MNDAKNLIVLSDFSVIQAAKIKNSLTAPHIYQVVRYNEQRLLAQPQPFGFHRCRHHFKGFASAHTVGQQRVVAVEDVRHGVSLVLPQRNLRIHAGEGDVRTIVLPGPDAVEALVVLPHQIRAALRVLENPRLKRLPN